MAKKCPRCGRNSLKANGEGDYAYSKTGQGCRGGVQICSDCGATETIEFILGKLTPKEDWPLE